MSAKGVKSVVSTVIDDGIFTINSADDAVHSNGSIAINGGTVVVDSDGDGIDVNGAVEMTGGVVIVNGPTEQMNGALDYDAYFVISGGFLVAAGSSGMAQAPGDNSSQNSLLVNLSSALPAGTLVHIQNSSGNDLVTFSPTKQYQSISFSSAELVTGSSYTIYFGGSAEGTAVDGLYQDAAAAYSGGTEAATFSVSSAVTMLGQSARRR